MPDAAYYDWFAQNNQAAETLGFTTTTLEPETMDSYELNYHLEVNAKMSVGLNVYYNEFEDQLSWGALQNIWTDAEADAINSFNNVTWGGGLFQNLKEKAEAFGVEYIVSYQVLENTRLKLSYDYVDLSGFEVQRYPYHQVKLNVTSHFMDDKLTVGFNYLMNGTYEDISSYAPNQVVSDDIYSNRQRHLFDLFGSYKISDKLTARLSVENLFAHKVPRMNVHSHQPARGNLGADERLVYFSLDYRF